MRNRQPVMQKLAHYFPAKDRLRCNSGDGDHSEPSQPAALIFGPHPNSQNDGQKPQNSGNYAMRMFVTDAAHHRGRERAVGKRPIWNGERGLVGSNQSAGYKKKDGPADHKNSKPMDRRMVSGRHWSQAQRRIIHDWWMHAIRKMASNSSN